MTQAQITDKQGVSGEVRNRMKRVVGRAALCISIICGLYPTVVAQMSESHRALLDRLSRNDALTEREADTVYSITATLYAFASEAEAATCLLSSIRSHGLREVTARKCALALMLERDPASSIRLLESVGANSRECVRECYLLAAASIDVDRARLLAALPSLSYHDECELLLIAAGNATQEKGVRLVEEIRKKFHGELRASESLLQLMGVTLMLLGKRDAGEQCIADADSIGAFKVDLELARLTAARRAVQLQRWDVAITLLSDVSTRHVVSVDWLSPLLEQAYGHSSLSEALVAQLDLLCRRHGRDGLVRLYRGRQLLRNRCFGNIFRLLEECTFDNSYDLDLIKECATVASNSAESTFARALRMQFARIPAGESTFLPLLIDALQQETEHSKVQLEEKWLHIVVKTANALSELPLDNLNNESETIHALLKEASEARIGVTNAGKLASCGGELLIRAVRGFTQGDVDKFYLRSVTGLAFHCMFVRSADYAVKRFFELDVDIRELVRTEFITHLKCSAVQLDGELSQLQFATIGPFERTETVLQAASREIVPADLWPYAIDGGQ